MEYSQTSCRKKQSRLKRLLRKYSLQIFIASCYLLGMISGIVITLVASAVISAHTEPEIVDKPQSEIVTYHHEKQSGKPDNVIAHLDYRTKQTACEDEYEWMKFTATAYCSCEKCCGKYAKNRPTDENGAEIVYTASGKVAQQGLTIAADWNVLPCGTIVEIDGWGTYEVQDKCGAIKDAMIDVYFDNHDEALEFGVKDVSLRIIDIGGEK